MQWFENGIQEGENGVLVYPNSQTFREIYSQYAKDQLAPKEEQKGKKGDEDNENDYYHNNAGRNEHLLVPRITLIATFYDTVNAVKHNLSAVGVDVQSHRRWFVTDSRCI